MTPPVTPPPPRATPLTLGRFEIERRLGAGGMAEVFVARKRGAEGTSKTLVVKRILPAHLLPGAEASRRFRTMFVEEALVATRLNHPNVVQVYEFEDGGAEGLLLAMEYVEGPDLGQLMAAARGAANRIPPWVAAYVIAEAAKGLHYAHERKDEGGEPLEIVHRDVSPQNVLLSYDGAVKIADFGIASAKLFAPEAGILKGKFGYMSPEQARGEKIDRRSDVYALGVILWEALTGRALHGTVTGEALLDVVRLGQVEPPSTFAADLPPELEEIAMRALERDREARFPTARDVSAAIARALLLRQELVDAAAVEAAIATLLPREALEGAPAPRDPITSPERRRRGGSERAHRRDLSERGGAREVRHVALVSLALQVAKDAPMPAKALARLQAMLGEMAYKRGLRAWTWLSPVTARAVAGLTSNPARAASDAAQLALEVHEAVAGMGEDLGAPISPAIAIVRGLASGTREPNGDLVAYRLHEPVEYLADLVGAKTPPDKTWVAGGFYRIVRREFVWGEGPTLTLDPDDAGVAALPSGMRLYSLERSLSAKERAARAADKSDLVGRDAEKADILAAFYETVHGAAPRAARSGTPRPPPLFPVVRRAIVGEVGIGKTALVAAALLELPPSATVVRVACSPGKTDVPFATIGDVVKGALGLSGDETFDDVYAAASGRVASMFDGEGAPLIARCLTEVATGGLGREGGGDEDPAIRRRLIVHGLRALFGSLRAQGVTPPDDEAPATPPPEFAAAVGAGVGGPLLPVTVLAVDGVQWADRPSIEVLVELLRTEGSCPTLALFVTRPDERAAPLLEGTVRIELRALGEGDQVRLVESRLGVRGGVRAVLADLLPRVGGNPFFLLELVDALLERGALEIREGEAGGALVRTESGEASFDLLPQTLEQLQGDRLRELPDHERAIVDWLAVAASPLACSVLATLVRTEADASPPVAEVDDALARLSARGLCDRTGDTVDFRHPLTRDVAYAALLPDDRVAMHRALGEALGEGALGKGISAAIVARHLARGESGERAAGFYLEAAAAVRASHQMPLAVRYLRRALTLLSDDDPRRFDAHEELEAIARVGGRRIERARHLLLLRRMAQSLGSPRHVTIALLRTARFDLDEGRLARGLPIARKAAAAAHIGRIAACEVEAEALVGEFLRELGDVQGALAACDRALAACQPRLFPGLSVRARADVLRARGVLLRRVGRVSEAIQSYAEAIGVFRKTGARRQEARAKHALAFAVYCQGHFEDCIALAKEAIEIDLSVGGRFQIANTLTNIGQAYASLGDSERALAFLKRAREAHERYGDQDARADTLTVSAEVLLEAGDTETAELFLRDAGALNAATGNAYDRTHERLAWAVLARARRDAKGAIVAAFEARRAAETHALVSFHFYGLALEAAARVDGGEMHAGQLLATTALGAVETLQGCEYGLEIRVLAADALKRAGSHDAPRAMQKAIDYASALAFGIRDKRLRKLFIARPLVASLFDATPIPSGELDPLAEARSDPPLNSGST